MPNSSMSRRSFLGYGAGAVASAAVLPALSRSGLLRPDNLSA
jgi:hypothetical protein